MILLEDSGRTPNLLGGYRQSRWRFTIPITDAMTRNTNISLMIVLLGLMVLAAYLGIVPAVMPGKR